MQDAQVDDLIRRVTRAAEKVEAMAGNTNTTVIKLAGQGPLWGMLAVGVALGATILGTVWIMATLNRQEMKIQQGAAYQQAVYALAPRFAAEIDAELTRQKEAENVHANPDHHGSNPSADDSPSEPAASAAP